MSTEQAQRPNALLTLPANRMRVEHTVGAGWTAIEYIGGRAGQPRSFASWPELTAYLGHYAGVITCSQAIARALAGGYVQMQEQESGNG